MNQVEQFKQANDWYAKEARKDKVAGCVLWMLAGAILLVSLSMLSHSEEKKMKAQSMCAAWVY